MILLESERRWKCGPLEFEGGRWYVEAATAGAALGVTEGVKVWTVDEVILGKVWNLGRVAEDWNGRRALLGTSGGFGDLLFWTPVFRELKARWPGMELVVACTPYFHDALRRNPCVDRLENFPVAAEVVEGADVVIWPEGLMEWSPRARELHYVDCLAEWMGLELRQGKELDFVVDLEAVKRLHERGLWARRDRVAKPRLGVQMRASARCRSYDGELLGKVVNAMLARGWEVLMMGSPEEGEVPEEARAEGLWWLPWEKPGLSFGESAALVSTCDVMLAPDSALCHVAGALKVPTVALFGSYPWELRTKYAPSVRALRGVDRWGCAPCFHNERGGWWPEHGPCWRTGRCEVLATIEVERVVREVVKAKGTTDGTLIKH